MLERHVGAIAIPAVMNSLEIFTKSTANPPLRMSALRTTSAFVAWGGHFWTTIDFLFFDNPTSAWGQTERNSQNKNERFWRTRRIWECWISRFTKHVCNLRPLKLDRREGGPGKAIRGCRCRLAFVRLLLRKLATQEQMSCWRFSRQQYSSFGNWDDETPQNRNPVFSYWASGITECGMIVYCKAKVWCFQDQL